MPLAEPTLPSAMSSELGGVLRCPVTGEGLELDGEGFLRSPSGPRHPVVDGVPVLLNEERSLFSASDYLERGRAKAGGLGDRLQSAARRIAHASPGISRNVMARENFRLFATEMEKLAGEGHPARVLVIGGAMAGAGFEALLDSPAIDIVETDVTIGPRTQVVCDAHDLPFCEGAFDGLVAQAVLEHVADPYRVVEEIHRVLRGGGVVYSEIPFMQQVHEGAFDFTRFTQVGQRRLFRHFDEIRSGAQGGPGMALAWSIQYFLTSFCGRSRIARVAVARLASLVTFWLKYLDGFLVRRPGGLDAASGTFFLGRRREEPISDRQVIESYRGAQMVTRGGRA